MKRILVLLLAVMMVLPLFVACNSGEGNTTTKPDQTTVQPGVTTPTVTDTNVPTGSNEPEGTTETPVTTLPVGGDGKCDVPEEKINYEVTVLSHRGAWQSYDVIGYEAVNLEARKNANIAAAIEARNDKMEETYGVTFQNIAESNLTNLVQRAVVTNRHQYDIILPNLSEAGEMAQKGLFIPVQELEYCETDESWYNQRALNELDINGLNFFFFTDITVVDLDAIWVYFFNYKVLEKYQLDVPYELLASGDWTLDTMLAMCEIVTDKDAANMTKDNYWGLAGHDFNVTAFYAGAGEKIAIADNSGKITLTMNSGRIGDVITASLKFRPYWIRYPLYSQNLKGDYPGTDERFGFVAGDNYPQIVECFTTGHTLFMGEVLSTLAELSNYDIEAGVLPVPKLNKEQKEYYSTTTSSATAMAVPTTTQDTTRISKIIDAWAYESSQTLLPVYKENCMKGVYSQDLITPEVLEDIFNSATYDMGIYYNWGQLASRYRALVYSGSSDFTSLYRGYSGTAENDIKAFLKQYS
jgi:hypothetical protein